MLKEVLGVQFSMGARYGLWWVWLERCRDGGVCVCVCSSLMAINSSPMLYYP